MKRFILFLRAILLVSLIVVVAYSPEGFDNLLPRTPRKLSAEHMALLKQELSGRSFRRLIPSIDADQRTAVILDFHQGMRIQVQLSEERISVFECEFGTEAMQAEAGPSASGVTLLFAGTANIHDDISINCESRDRLEAVSVSIRNLFDRDRMRFRLNDPHQALPAQFLILGSWAEYPEDEVVD